MRRRTFLAATGLAASTLSGCLGAGSRGLSRDDYDVGMSANAFQPRDIEIRVSDTVVWGNTSSRAHSVTAYEAAIPEDADYFATGGFDEETAARDGWLQQRGRDGGKIFTGETYEHTFSVPGEYEYFCIPHEATGMVGTVVVTE